MFLLPRECREEAFTALHAAVSDRLEASSLLETVRANGELTVDEIVSNVAVLLFGGVVTSESTTAIAVQFILSDRRVFADFLTGNDRQ